MAAAILKNLLRWIEGQLQSSDNPEVLVAVQEALEAILVDASPLSNRQHKHHPHAAAEEPIAGGLAWETWGVKHVPKHTSTRLYVLFLTIEACIAAQLKLPLFG